MKKSTTLKSKAKSATAEELDRIFDEGQQDITDYMDLSELRRPHLELRRVSVDMPVSMIRRLDRAAQLRGMSRQSLIKAILFDVIEAHDKTPIYVRTEEGSGPIGTVLRSGYTRYTNLGAKGEYTYVDVEAKGEKWREKPSVSAPRK